MDETVTPAAVHEPLQIATLASSIDYCERPAVGGISWLAEVLQRIGQLRALESDWDGYGAEPLSASAARRGLEFLAAITAGGRRAIPAPFLAPIHSGIQIEWDRSGMAIEIELRSDSNHLLLEDGERVTFDGPLAEGLGALFEALRKITATAEA